MCDATTSDAPVGCDLSLDPKDSPACVADSVGVFVDSTKSDGNTGTMESPVATIAHGLDFGRNARDAANLRLAPAHTGKTSYWDVAHDGISIYGGWKCARLELRHDRCAHCQ